jgi:hypothetical protein
MQTMHPTKNEFNFKLESVGYGNSHEKSEVKQNWDLIIAQPLNIPLERVTAQDYRL